MTLSLSRPIAPDLLSLYRECAGALWPDHEGAIRREASYGLDVSEVSYASI